MIPDLNMRMLKFAYAMSLNNMTWPYLRKYFEGILPIYSKSNQMHLFVRKVSDTPQEIYITL